MICSMILAAQKIKRNQLPSRNPTTASSNTKGKVPPWVLIKRTLCRIMNIIFMGLNNEQLISILIENVQQNIWVILGIPGEVPVATCLKWQLPIPLPSSVSSHNTCHQLVFYFFLNLSSPHWNINLMKTETLPISFVCIPRI